MRQLGALLLTATVLLTGCHRTTDPAPVTGSPDSTSVAGTSAAPTTSTPPATPTAVRPSPSPSADRDRETGLRLILESALPDEAHRTLRLIRSGGPFPYRQDGTIYENRSRALPGHSRGWYREYTVVTPGEKDRGPRRIVVGKDGVKFWTVDHYDSFHRIKEGS